MYGSINMYANLWIIGHLYIYSSMIYHIHAEFLPSTVVWIVHSPKNSHLESCFCRDDLFASLGPWNLSNKNEPPLERELFPTIQQANRRRWTLQMNDALEFETCLAVSLKGCTSTTQHGRTTATNRISRTQGWTYGSEVNRFEWKTHTFVQYPNWTPHRICLNLFWVFFLSCSEEIETYICNLVCFPFAKLHLQRQLFSHV